MTFKDFLKKFSFEKRGPDTSNRFRGCPPPGISQSDIDILKRMSERKKPNMGIDYRRLAERDLDHLKRIIENKNEPTSTKIDRIILWQREKRATELHNLVRYHFRNLHQVLSMRSESAWRGIEFMRDKIDRDTKPQQKEPNMMPTVELTVTGPEGCGKASFLRVVRPLLEMAAKMTLTGNMVQIKTNARTEDESVEDVERATLKAEMLMSLERMEQLENDRYAARTRMNQLLRELGHCPREVDALTNENDAENHNVMSFITKLRKDAEEGNV